MLTWDTDRTSGVLVSALSIAGLVLAWWGLAIWTADPTVLPGPWQVLPLVGSEIASGELVWNLAATLRRVLLAFIIAMSVGFGIGLLMGRNQTSDRWLDPWLVVFLNLPALVTIVLCYLWIGLNEVAAVAAVAINKIPSVAVTIREGARALDPRLDNVATVFRMSLWSKLRHVVIPQLAPFIATASRSGLAVIWKIVLVVEFLGRSDGIGFKIHLYFQQFDVGMVLAYAISFILVMLAVEGLFLRRLEAHVSRWRRA